MRANATAGENYSPDIITLIEEASTRIYGLARQTPVARLPRDSRLPSSLRAFAKMEQQQVTGSFKLRGASNKIFSMSPEIAAKGVVTSSTGNHGLGVAAAARFRGIDAEVYLSSQVPEAKWRKIVSFGGGIRTAGTHPLEAELAARAAAGETGHTYGSPYTGWMARGGGGTLCG